MKTLTQNEIARTSFRAVSPGLWESPFGYTSPHRDKNEMCPYCKNEDTVVVRDAAYLEPFKEWYRNKVDKFTVMHCWCCTAVWSFYAANA